MPVVFLLRNITPSLTRIVVVLQPQQPMYPYASQPYYPPQAYYHPYARYAPPPPSVSYGYYSPMMPAYPSGEYMTMDSQTYEPIVEQEIYSDWCYTCAKQHHPSVRCRNCDGLGHLERCCPHPKNY